MTQVVLYIVVATAGAAVLAVEILGTRVLGPFYGVGLFLWSALITVTLAALAVGYGIGGRWADRGPRLRRLAVLLAGAGTWLLVVPWIRHPLLEGLQSLGLRAAVLAAAALLFAPPLLLLGMVSPYAVRLRARSLADVGRAAGDLFALSTLASVVSALATGFYLVPLLGVSRLLLALGVALLAVAALAFLADRDRRDALVAAALAAAGGLAWSGAARGVDPARGVVFLADSPYGEVRVLERDGTRYLLLDGGAHTAVTVGSWRSTHRYVAAVGVAQHLVPAPGRLLLVGLGGGAVAKDFASRGWDVDAVEIDATVIRVAREHFGLGANECRLFCMDGRRFLRTHAGLYDLIVLDAFGSSAIPFHLVTREFFALVTSRLTPDGIVAINVETRGWDDDLLAAIAATLGTQLPTVVALPTSEPPNTLGNVMLLGSRRALELPEGSLGHPKDFLHDPELHWLLVQQNHAWDNRYVPAMAGAPILTDDRNPIDLWAEAVNRQARLALHAFFGAEGRSW